MAMFGKGGQRVLNQIGMNLLGVDVMGMQSAAERRRQQQEFLDRFGGMLKPEYAPTEDINVSLDPSQSNASTWQYQPPQRTRDPININSPDLPAQVMEASRLGVNLKPIIDVLQAQQPDWAVAPDGSTYNKRGSGLPGRFRTPQAVNDTIVDVGNPENENRVIPKAPVNGAMPVYDNRGHVIDWTLPQGAQATIANAAGAEAGGRAAGSAPYDFITVPGPNGQPMVVSKARAVGGAFEGQTPADAEYDKGLAAAEQERYQGFLTAGANAGKKLATYGRIQTLLKDVDGGRLTPVGTEIASALNSVGFQVDKNLGNKQAAEALMNQLVLEANGGSLGTGVSNADVQFIAKSGPNMMQSADGRQKLVAFAVAREKRAQDVAKMARQWQQRAGRLDRTDRNGKSFYDYLDAWAEANPLVVQ